MKKKLLALPVLLLLFACGGKEYSVVDTEKEARLINEKTSVEIKKLSTDRVFFKFDSAAIGDKSKLILDSIVEWLQSDSNIKILVEGHCDERGTREYNLALGQRRADAVKKYLVSKGINSVRIKTISYGKEKPAFIGKGEAIWSKNRRSVIIPTK